MQTLDDPPHFKIWPYLNSFPFLSLRIFPRCYIPIFDGLVIISSSSCFTTSRRTHTCPSPPSPPRLSSSQSFLFLVVRPVVLSFSSSSCFSTLRRTHTCPSLAFLSAGPRTSHPPSLSHSFLFDQSSFCHIFIKYMYVSDSTMSTYVIQQCFLCPAPALPKSP